MEIHSKNCSAKDTYKLLSGLVVPRPIALVSTKDAQGRSNVAPFSFFNVVANEPPTVMFSADKRNGEKKDTIANIESHPEFVINIVSEKMAQKMHNSAADFKKEVNEFDEVGLTPIAAQTINCDAVKESLAHLECKLDRIIKVGKSYMVLGEVIHFSIDDQIYLNDYKIDIEKLKPLARLAGREYGRVHERFELEQEFDQTKVIE